MNYIVNMCPLTEFEDRLQLLHDVEDDTLSWLLITATTCTWNDWIAIFYRFVIG